MVSLSNKHACIILYHHDRYHHGFMNDAITKTGSPWKFIHINSFCIIVCRLDVNTPQGSWVFAWLSDCSMSDANNTAHMSCSVSFQVALPAYKSYFRCSLCLKWQKVGVVSHKTSQWAFKNTIEPLKQKQRAEESVELRWTHGGKNTVGYCGWLACWSTWHTSSPKQHAGSTADQCRPPDQSECEWHQIQRLHRECERAPVLLRPH